MKNQSYKHSHTSENFGAYYDESLFSGDTYDNRVWSIEKRLLSEYFYRANDLNNKNVLDFACGTGRIAKLLTKFNFREIVCIDISDPMIEMAKNFGKESCLNLKKLIFTYQI